MPTFMYLMPGIVVMETHRFITGNATRRLIRLPWGLKGILLAISVPHLQVFYTLNLESQLFV